MSIKLNLDAFEHAKELIKKKQVVLDDGGTWSENRPTPESEDEFLRQHGYVEYGKWFLGIDDRRKENSKERYKFPYGDFRQVHHSGVMAVEHTACEAEYYAIEVAASELHGMIDAGKV